MNTGQTAMSESLDAEPRRSFGQLILCVCAALLAAGFLFRTLQYGYRWVTHAVSADFNYKALTLWSAFYFLLCTAIAALAFPRRRSAVTQNADRGT